MAALAIKKVFLKILQNSQENTFCQDPLLVSWTQ